MEDVGIAVPNTLPSSLYNLMQAGCVLVVIVWVINLLVKLLKYHELEAAVLTKHVMFVPRVGYDLKGIRNYARAHLQHVLGKSHVEASCDVSRAELPFRAELVSPSEVTLAQTPAHKFGVALPKLQLRMQTSTPVFVSVAWGVHVAAAAALHHGGVEGLSAFHDAGGVELLQMMAKELKEPAEAGPAKEAKDPFSSRAPPAADMNGAPASRLRLPSWPSSSHADRAPATPRRVTPRVRPLLVTEEAVAPCPPVIVEDLSEGTSLFSGRDAIVIDRPLLFAGPIASTAMRSIDLSFTIPPQLHNPAVLRGLCLDQTGRFLAVVVIGRVDEHKMAPASGLPRLVHGSGRSAFDVLQYCAVLVELRRVEQPAPQADLQANGAPPVTPVPLAVNTDPCSSLTLCTDTLAVLPTMSYSLKEVYGLERDTDAECVVCLTEYKCIMLLPCRHVCVCRDCFKHLTKCPVCRTDFETYISMHDAPETKRTASKSHLAIEPDKPGHPVVMANEGYFASLRKRLTPRFIRLPSSPVDSLSTTTDST